MSADTRPPEQRRGDCNRCGHEFDPPVSGGATEWTPYRCDGAGESECDNLICWTCLLKSDLCKPCQASDAAREASGVAAGGES